MMPKRYAEVVNGFLYQMMFVVLTSNTTGLTMAKKRTYNTIAKRKWTDNTMAKRKRTDNTMAKRKRTNNDLQNIT
jgi:hypothetical protein